MNRKVNKSNCLQPEQVVHYGRHAKSGGRIGEAMATWRQHPMPRHALWVLLPSRSCSLWQHLTHCQLVPWQCLKVSKEIGGDVQSMQRGAIQSQVGVSSLGYTASQCQQPAGSRPSDLLAPSSEQVQEMITFLEKNQGRSGSVSCHRTCPSPELRGYGSQAQSLSERNE